MRVLITGITGTLGTLVREKMLAMGCEVIGFSRDECKQAAIPKHKNLTLYLGDIREKARLIEASRKIDLIFHFAALKHVDQLEANPEEAIRTNILGTENVLHAQRVHAIPRVLLSSTDKAAYPVNAYGMTKGISERLVLRNPNNIVCRYGNVLASRGSVVESFVRTLKSDNRVDLTDANMTRFWITPEEAAEFVVKSAFVPHGGLRIPPMKGASITAVAACIAQILNINAYRTVEVGTRAGEKVHECLRTSYEGEETHSHLVAQYTDAELRAVLDPIVRSFA